MRFIIVAPFQPRTNVHAVIACWVGDDHGRGRRTARETLVPDPGRPRVIPGVWSRSVICIHGAGCQSATITSAKVKVAPGVTDATAGWESDCAQVAAAAIVETPASAIWQNDIL